jgi:hypothetical protein
MYTAHERQAHLRACRQALARVQDDINRSVKDACESKPFHETTRDVKLIAFLRDERDRLEVRLKACLMTDLQLATRIERTLPSPASELVSEAWVRVGPLPAYGIPAALRRLAGQRARRRAVA